MSPDKPTPEPLDKGPADVQEAMKKPTLVEKYGAASLEARYNIEFPTGSDRAAKRRYVEGLKKALKKKIKIGSPEYWELMKNYGFTRIEKKKKKKRSE